ncbi:matrixin family metalloprotease [bacterium]|nr:matrixin family metalloprotease [bacterium]
MKKIVICTVLMAAGAASLMNMADRVDVQSPEFTLKNSYAMTLRYDKSMGEKTIKAAVIDSYFRSVASNGKIIRWNKDSMPLRVYIQDSADVPGYYREIVMSAYQAWQRASEGLVSFEFVESPSEADMKCYFKNTDNKKSIGVHAFTINGNRISDSTIVFNKTDDKNHSLDSKQLFSSALQEIGHSLGLTGKSKSIYDVMYPIGTKFNTEITQRDLKTLGLLYSVVPDITNAPLSSEESSQLLTVSEVLATLNVPVTNDTKNLDEIVAGDVSTHLALAEQYRRRAEYEKAAKEYQAVAQLKTDRRSKSEVYYEIAVMYLDAEEYGNAKASAEIAMATDMNDLTETLPALINYYTKRSTSAVEQLETILKQNPYNKHAYKLLCKIYRDKHHENLLNSTIRKYGKTAGSED